MKIRLVLSLLAGIAGAVDAQASTDTHCRAVPADSVAAAVDTVFRQCEVDEPARLLRTARPSFAFTPQLQCASVDLEFVVGRDGRPVVASARVVRTTSDLFARQVIQGLGRWRYRPARRRKVAVSQLVSATYTLMDSPMFSQPAEASRFSRREPEPCR